MNQHTKDVYVIPSVITVVGGLLLIPVAAWFTNVPMRTVVTFAGIKNLWFAPVSAWVAFMFFVAAVFVVYLYRRSRTELRDEEQRTARLREEVGIVQDQIKLIRRDHEAELAALKSKEPKLHGIWIPTQAYWAYGAHGTQAATQVVGWIDMSSSNTKENIFLLAGYINGRRAQIFGDLTVRPGVVNKSQVFLFSGHRSKRKTASRLRQPSLWRTSSTASTNSRSRNFIQLPGKNLSQRSGSTRSCISRGGS